MCFFISLSQTKIPFKKVLDNEKRWTSHRVLIENESNRLLLLIGDATSVKILQWIFIAKMATLNWCEANHSTPPTITVLDGRAWSPSLIKFWIIIAKWYRIILFFIYDVFFSRQIRHTFFSSWCFFFKWNGKLLKISMCKQMNKRVNEQKKMSISFVCARKSNIEMYTYRILKGRT